MKLIYLIFLILTIFSFNSYAAFECPQYKNYHLEIGESLDILTSPTEKYCVVIHDTYNTGNLTYLGYSQSDIRFSMYQEGARGFKLQLNGGSSGAFISEDIRYAQGYAKIIIGKSPLSQYNDPDSFVTQIVNISTKMENGKALFMANINNAASVPSSDNSTSSSDSLQPNLRDLSTYSTPTISGASSENCNDSNTSPDAKPKSANLNANIRRMREFRSTVSVALSAQPAFRDAFTLTYFYNQVRNGAVMDYKQISGSYQDFGNYNYGAVGRALQIPRQVLKRAAGWAQIRANTSEEDFGHYLGSAPYGDDPSDQVQITSGMDYFDNVYSEVSSEQRQNGGKNGLTDFCNDKHNSESAGDGDYAGSDNGYGYSGAVSSPGYGSFYIPFPINFCYSGCGRIIRTSVTITDLEQP